MRYLEEDLIAKSILVDHLFSSTFLKVNWRESLSLLSLPYNTIVCTEQTKSL